MAHPHTHTPPSTLQAKAVLDQKGAKYTVYELDKESDGPALRAELGAKVDRTSVPAIWIDKGERIRGLVRSFGRLCVAGGRCVRACVHACNY